MVQEHHARRLHWDLRLEHDGSLASWALPRGVPEHPDENRLAVRTEDHPLEYLEFEGEIPKGEYGAGTMLVWDRGTYEAEKFRDDEVIATFHGERLNGRYALFRTRENDWMIHRMDPPADPDVRAVPGAHQADDGPQRAAAAARGAVRIRGQVGRDPGRRVLRPRPRRAPGPQPHATSRPATPRCATLARVAGRAACGARRRDRGLRRRGTPELRAPSVAHAPRLRLSGAGGACATSPPPT